MMRIKLRGLIRIISYITLAFIFLGISAYIGFSRANRLENELEYTYQFAISELSEHINNIDITLEKGLYAGTNAQLLGISAKVFTEASGAKISLGQLPVTNLNLEKTYKFLSQVGDFTLSVSKRLSENDKISETELESMKKLSEYAKILSSQISDIQARVNEGTLKISEVKTSILDSKNDPRLANLSINSGFKELEEGFTDFPTLIYDGPFSDHILQQKSRFLEGQKEIDEKKAHEEGTKFLGVNKNYLKTDYNTEGNLKTFNFQAIDISISVTKAGGYVSHFTNSRKIDSQKLGSERAVEIAKKYLIDKGYKNFENNYFQTNNGICVVNFNYMEGDYACYPDLVKVGVALDDGSVVSFDAQGYLMNHTQRSIPKVKISQDDARKSVSTRLKIDSVGLAVIPSSGGNELYCYEYSCIGEKDEKIKVYINTQTRREEQILIVLESENGALTM